MKIYLAGCRDTEGYADAEGRSARRLYSYFYLKTQQSERNDLATHLQTKEPDTFLDSGAFSAFTKKVKLDVREYAQFVLANAASFRTVSSLDDTFKNEQLSWDNWQTLNDMGCKTQPVFHTREDPEWLKRYLKETDYLFLGGMVPESTEWLRGWLDWLWGNYLTDSSGRAVVRVHGFGLTTFELMQRYPWYSVDSSSWLASGIFGNIFVWLNDGPQAVCVSDKAPDAKNVRTRHIKNLPPKEVQDIENQLAEHGATVAECAAHWRPRDKWNFNFFRRLEGRFGTDKIFKGEASLW